MAGSSGVWRDVGIPGGLRKGGGGRCGGPLGDLGWGSDGDREWGPLRVSVGARGGLHGGCGYFMGLWGTLWGNECPHGCCGSIHGVMAALWGLWVPPWGLWVAP